MPHKRTVRCRYCWSEGHNVKTCKSLEGQIKSDPGGYHARLYSKYFNLDGSKKQTSSTKNCSYCKEAGHTKRTCDTKIKHLVENIKTNAEYRKDILEFIKTNGLGVGSLVTIYNKMYLITQIHWDNFVCGYNEWDSNHFSLQPMESGGVYTKFQLDNYIIRYYKQSDMTAIKVESGVHEVQEPPTTWFSGRSSIYDNFTKVVTNPFRTTIIY